jgi:hypothetical protein
MRISKLTLLLGASLVFGGALQAASTYNYAFGGLGGDLGSNIHTFAPSAGPNPNIVATGFQTGSHSTVSVVDLYSKGSAGFPPPNDESGLGLTNDPTGDHEITPGSFIMLDFGNLSISKLDIYTESTTGGEEWEIWGSNTAVVAGQSFTIPTGLTGLTEGDQNVTSLSGDRYIFITSLGNSDNNILLGGLTATVATAPEPGSAGLLGFALISSSLLLRRRFGRKSQ